MFLYISCFFNSSETGFIMLLIDSKEEFNNSNSLEKSGLLLKNSLNMSEEPLTVFNNSR